MAHGVLHLVVDHALLHGAHFGDLLTVGGFEAAHLAAAHEPQLTAVRVEEDEVLDEQAESLHGIASLGLGRPRPGE